jgi:hypothetical protein
VLCGIAKLFINQPCLVGTKPERLRAMLAFTEGLGVSCGSPMFRYALEAVVFQFKKKRHNRPKGKDVG